jgi:hypothetical protein
MQVCNELSKKSDRAVFSLFYKSRWFFISCPQMHNLTLILPSFVVIKDELKFSFRDFWSGLHSLLRPALPVLQNTTTATEDTSYVNGNKSKHRST